tara:strand:+ start:410 stop:2596 length:2187 start_codon:yes stop_codon:yes gene_type:complete
MIKKIFKIIIVLFLIFFSSIVYLSLIGVETNKFNNQIINKVKNFNKDIDIELKQIKLILDPLNFNFNVKTLGPKINSNNQTIELELIKTQISIYSLLNNDFSLRNLEISTKSIEIKRLVEFMRTIYKSPELLIFKTFIKKGHLIADINLEFNEDGKIKKNFNIDGFVKDGKIDLFKRLEFEKINFNFSIEKENTQINELSFLYDELELFIETINTQNTNSGILVDGKLNNKNLEIRKKFLQNFITEELLDIQKVNFDSDSIFSFKVNNKYRIEKFKLDSKIKLNEMIIQNKYNLEKFFPQIKKKIILSNHKLNINFDNNKFLVRGDGDISFQNSKDKINYEIDKKNKIFNFDAALEIRNNPLKIDFLNFKNQEITLTKINFNGQVKEDGNIKFKKIFLKNAENTINIQKILLNKKFEILSLSNAEFKYFDMEKIQNNFFIKKEKKNYILSGKIINANDLIEKLLSDDQNKPLPFNSGFKLNINLKKVLLDEKFKIYDFQGYLKFKNKNFIEANLNGVFEQDKELKFIIKSINNEKTTIFYSDYAKPFIKRYKFIEGFEEGVLDYYSSTIDKKTNSTIKVYDFKLNKLPALTKLLTLASLQGIADLLTGEGIRFSEFEMNHDTKDNLMTIKEIYAIGPAISILMDGYIEKNELISLRGTMVPATTINKVIGSIPFFGDILVGSKSGEGVFGVSFKIKGPPKKLETTVNPIKTLTPRFITRTLEKIKKTN